MSKSRAEVNRHFHGEVDMGDGITADYVVSHAARQKQRGRNPSLRYRDIANPRAALAAAEADVEARDSDASDADYAVFSGKVVIMRVWSERSRDIANKYAEARIEENGAVGAIVKDIQDGEVLQAPLHYRVTDEGTVEAMLSL